ncbi:thiamine pyrophosphate-binding protein [Nitrincola alkalisediminis]|uniref:thiamine pyrophosphate-binding protein n=1 Tax=Nitrincola alkalisediminis TaxID=1366656 RepID=UPI0018734FC5|nr:thiamine pyrophosphate-binding protein [Nitrincola alkalisediminis]
MSQPRASQSRHTKSFWFRWRFHLSGLLLILPMVAMPFYFDDLAMSRGEKGLGERDLGQHQVGPWQIQLAEWDTNPPWRDGVASYMKTFSLSLCETCIPEVKAAYMRIGKPRNLRTAGAISFGTPYRQFISVPITDSATADADIWLTLEGWDGSVHQISMPLADASPSAATFIQRRNH